ncbi:MAG: AAA family ATPase [Saprospiraceae bacterium]|nr:AAA family ATPase [Saprospiraceae bacterium]
MIKVFLTKGLPASGKSTWAKKIIAENPNSYKRINKDDLRAMLDDSKYSNDSEKFILQVRDAMILMAIENGKHVIIDDTNLAPKHEARIRELIKGKAKLVIQDFTDVSLETCIERDLKRVVSVGEKVIRGVHKQFLLQVETYTENTELPKAIIVDIDGTLAKMNGRSPFEWGKIKEDICNVVVKGLVNSYNGTVIILSGRDGICKQDTIDWLKTNEIKYAELFMRDEGNNEKDTIIKRRMFEQNIRGKYFVEYVLDDRNQVVEMWRNMGLICLQVADGDF